MIKMLLEWSKAKKRIIQLRINKIGSKRRNKKIINKGVTIISNNCFAGITYEYLNMRYNSPTIGLYFFAPEYIKFINNLKHYTTTKLEKISAEESKYYSELKKLKQENRIIGKIDDVEIVFLHYDTFEEAREKWERRCKRINYDSILYKFNDQNLCTQKELEAFYNFEAENKICFTAKDYRKYGFIWMKKFMFKKYVIEDSYYYHRNINIIDKINKMSSPKKRKKVLHVLLSNRYSGAENVACTIIEQLRDEHEQAYCCPRGDIQKILKRKGIQYIPINSLSLRELRKVIKRYNPDIIHAHDYRTSFKCAIVKGDRSLITHLHNNSPWLKTINPKSIALLATAQKSRVVLTVSNAIKEEYIFSKIIDNKIMQIGNPTDRDKIISAAGSKDENKKYDICCVARISAPKNPIKFAKVIKEVKKEIPQIKAIWIGGSNECDKKTNEDFRAYISKNHLSKNITLVGHKSNPYRYVKQSKIFLLTSDWEGFGLAAFEALSLGLPCIVSRVGGLPSIVDDKCGKLCTCLNDYVDVIIRLLKNKNMYTAYSNAATAKSEKISNIKSYTETMKKIYKTI